MRRFDAYLVVDGSARNAPSPGAPTTNTLWVGEALAHASGRHTVSDTYWRTRKTCLTFVLARLREHVRCNRRVFVGWDFALGYPAGTAEATR